MSKHDEPTLYVQLPRAFLVGQLCCVTVSLIAVSVQYRRVATHRSPYRYLAVELLPPFQHACAVGVVAVLEGSRQKKKCTSTVQTNIIPNLFLTDKRALVTTLHTASIRSQM